MSTSTEREFLFTLTNGDWLLMGSRSRVRHLPRSESFIDRPRGMWVHTRCGQLAQVCHPKHNDGRWSDCKACRRA